MLYLSHDILLFRFSAYKINYIIRLLFQHSYKYNFLHRVRNLDYGLCLIVDNPKFININKKN